VQNLTSYFCSLALISYEGGVISRISRLIFEICRGTDRQTTDRQTRRPFYKRLTHTVKVCDPNNTKDNVYGAVIMT